MTTGQVTASRWTIPFPEFVRAVRPGYQWYRHCAVLGDALQQVADGSIKRLMVFMPPRHGKSEAASRLFAAYFLRRWPDRWVGINSYSSDLAFTLSRAARENFLAAGGRIKADAKAVKHWETAQGGGLWSAGVGGPITGKGFHLGIIDDPLKNAEEAASQVIREKQKEWYSSTFYTREEPGGAIILIETRWHEDDLAGWLLSEEETGDSPERWHIVNLAALADDAPPFPASCTLTEDWRAPGEALCPERYGAEKLGKIRERIGAYYWNALYQQRPVPREGVLFKLSALEIVESVPTLRVECRAWDTAATPGGGDYTVGFRGGLCENGLFWITDVVRGQWSPDERNALIKQTAALDGRGVRIRGQQEPGSAGVDMAQAFVRMLAGYNVRTVRPTGDKIVRADPFAAYWNAGQVRMKRAAWNRAVLDEFSRFPLGATDDIVDAGSDCFTELTGRAVIVGRGA